MSKNSKLISNALRIGRFRTNETVKKVSQSINLTEESIKKAEVSGNVNAKSLYMLLDYYKFTVKVFDESGNQVL